MLNRIYIIQKVNQNGHSSEMCVCVCVVLKLKECVLCVTRGHRVPLRRLSCALGMSISSCDHGSILLDAVRCTGNELFLEQCPHGDWEQHNCDHMEDAGVSCSPYTGTCKAHAHSLGLQEAIYIP